MARKARRSPIATAVVIALSGPAVAQQSTPSRGEQVLPEVKVEGTQSGDRFRTESTRSATRTDTPLRRAYASAYHWQRARGAGPANEARALYMLAKVHLVAGLPERSLHYADAGMTQCTTHGLVDFDLAYAHEARARALRALGREAEGLAAWAAAKAVPIADPEDLAIVEGDFADAPVTA